MRADINRITGLKVKGFKSIVEEQPLIVKPLTILAGANSSGKSSIMQPLLLLKQTLEAAGDPGAIQLDGEHVRFTSADQLLGRTVGGQNVEEFGVQIELRNSESLYLSYRRHAGRGFEVGSMSYGSKGRRHDIRLGMKHAEIVELIPDPLKSVYDELIKQANVTWSVMRDRCFLAFELVDRDENGPFRFGLSGISPAASFIPYIQGIIHLPGLRGNPKRTYPKTAVGPHFQGTFEQYVASIISGWQSTQSDKLDRLADSLAELGLTWKVRADFVEDTQIQLKVGRLRNAKRGGAHDMVSIADVGLGVSQSLPVVVSLLEARPGQLVYLEQPEIHLHPMAQRGLAKLLLEASKRGVVVVAETHSSLLIKEIQTMIASRHADADDVALHWFTRNENGDTNVTTAELDDTGAYGDWPADFDITELAAEKAYLDAVELRQP